MSCQHKILYFVKRGRRHCTGLFILVFMFVVLNLLNYIVQDDLRKPSLTTQEKNAKRLSRLTRLKERLNLLETKERTFEAIPPNNCCIEHKNDETLTIDQVGQELNISRFETHIVRDQRSEKNYRRLRHTIRPSISVILLLNDGEFAFLKNNVYGLSEKSLTPLLGHFNEGENQSEAGKRLVHTAGFTCSSFTNLGTRITLAEFRGGHGTSILATGCSQQKQNSTLKMVRLDSKKTEDLLLRGEEFRDPFIALAVALALLNIQQYQN